MSLHGYSNREYDVGDENNVTLISKLDVSHPLHLHPNDFVALTVVSVKLKGTENYQVWSCVMLLALEGKNKTGFIDGTCRRTKHVWEELKETYDKVDGSVTFSLHHKIHTLSQNGSSIAGYYQKLNALWKQFDALIELPRCTCHAADDFKKHNQLMKLMQFFMGLDDHYMQIRSSILSREVLPDVRSAYAIISSEESNRITSGRVSKPSQRSQASAFSVNMPNKGNFQRPQVTDSSQRPSNNNGVRRTTGGSNLDGQNFKGKNVSNNAVGSSSSSSSSSTTTTSSNNSGFSDEQLSTLISLIKE
ncbi:ribonuclease H-like domain-containing protein, partial [Tanacetum coccineum]